MERFSKAKTAFFQFQLMVRVFCIVQANMEIEWNEWRASYFARTSESSRNVEWKKCFKKLVSTEEFENIQQLCVVCSVHTFTPEKEGSCEGDLCRTAMYSISILMFFFSFSVFFLSFVLVFWNFSFCEVS